MENTTLLGEIFVYTLMTGMVLSGLFFVWILSATGLPCFGNTRKERK